MAIGLDAFGATGPASYWTVGISRKNVGDNTPLFTSGSGIERVVYEPGSLLVAVPRTAAEIALWQRCAPASVAGWYMCARRGACAQRHV